MIEGKKNIFESKKEKTDDSVFLRNLIKVYSKSILMRIYNART